MSIAGRPLRPLRADIEYLAGRMEAELKRNEGLLPEPALAEFREALQFYREKQAGAR